MDAGSARLTVRVRSITYQGEQINAYEVVDPAGKELPRFTAGAHVDLHFRDGRVRQYSLCNDPRETHRYLFTVQREAEGRGGSKAVFDMVHPGTMLTISEPRNNFPIVRDARRHLFVAGGIGITPIMSMIRHARAVGASFELHYCTRSPERTAFLDELRELERERKAVLYHDGGDPKQGLDMTGLLQEYRPGTHLYYCGPSGFMAGVKAAASHWPQEAVHCEYFSVPTDGAASPGGSTDNAIGVGFQVKLARSGQTFDIANDKSITQVLRENGIEVPTSCESGLCGTCRTQYLEGTPDHRDYILTDEEKIRTVLICCARSRTPLIVLDL